MKAVNTIEVLLFGGFGNGTLRTSFLKLSINYDSSKLNEINEENFNSKILITEKKIVISDDNSSNDSIDLDDNNNTNTDKILIANRETYNFSHTSVINSLNERIIIMIGGCYDQKLILFNCNTQKIYSVKNVCVDKLIMFLFVFCNCTCDYTINLHSLKQLRQQSKLKIVV